MCPLGLRKASRANSAYWRPSIATLPLIVFNLCIDATKNITFVILKVGMQSA
jgi:hypothetical protein